jgi:hypothetical protein
LQKSAGALLPEHKLTMLDINARAGMMRLADWALGKDDGVPRVDDAEFPHHDKDEKTAKTAHFWAFHRSRTSHIGDRGLGLGRACRRELVDIRRRFL